MHEKLTMDALRAEVLDQLRDGATPKEAAQNVTDDLTTDQLMDLLQEDPYLLNSYICYDDNLDRFANKDLPTANYILKLVVGERLFDWAEEQPEATNELE